MARSYCATFLLRGWLDYRQRVELREMTPIRGCGGRSLWQWWVIRRTGVDISRRRAAQGVAPLLLQRRKTRRATVRSAKCTAYQSFIQPAHRAFICAGGPLYHEPSENMRLVAVTGTNAGTNNHPTTGAVEPVAGETSAVMGKRCRRNGLVG